MKLVKINLNKIDEDFLWNDISDTIGKINSWEIAVSLIEYKLSICDIMVRYVKAENEISKV